MTLARATARSSILCGVERQSPHYVDGHDNYDIVVSTKCGKWRSLRQCFGKTFE